MDTSEINNELINDETKATNAFLVACGSFSPPTVLHTGIFDAAEKDLTSRGYVIDGKFMSPVHQGYGKKTLAPQDDRLAMAKCATNGTSIGVLDYECLQSGWTPTADVLDHYAKVFKAQYGNDVKVMLLCGGDVLATFPNVNADGSPVWLPADQEKILENGMVCICRQGFDLNELCKKSEIINKYRNNIEIVPIEENIVSSTMVRNLLKNGEDYSHLVCPAVKTYIEEHNLKSLPQWQ